MKFFSLLLFICFTYSLAQTLNIIPRNVVQGYKHDPSKIQENITLSASESGFLVQFVKANSLFEAWGLQKGDLLITANNVPLTSFSVAKIIYAHVMNHNLFTLILKRNGQQRILNYEIR